MVVERFDRGEEAVERLEERGPALRVGDPHGSALAGARRPPARQAAYVSSTRSGATAAIRPESTVGEKPSRAASSAVARTQ